ncbi:MAG: hypothetical protein R3D57_13655 [Hyphomicrobiaceae bacterium]
MSEPLLNRALSFAIAALAASLPLVWWTADLPSRPLHLAVGAGTAMLAVVAGVRLGQAEPAGDDLISRRRRATRLALLMAAVYIWAALAILVSYYLTALSWYHAYQYAAYATVPGLLALGAARRHRNGPDDLAAAALARGRRLAILQAVLMLVGLVYIVWLDKLRGSHADWAAIDSLWWGATAVGIISLVAARRTG